MDNTNRENGHSFAAGLTHWSLHGIVVYNWTNTFHSLTTRMFTLLLIAVIVTMRGKITQHDDVIKWKHFPRYWPFVWGIHRSPVFSPHKGQWRGALMFSLIWALNKRLSKQSWGWWFETPSCSLWRHCNGMQLDKFRWYSHNHTSCIMLLQTCEPIRCQ